MSRAVLALAGVVLLAGCSAPRPFTAAQEAAGLELAAPLTREQLRAQVEALFLAHRDEGNEAAARRVLDFWRSPELALAVAPRTEVTSFANYECTNIILDFPGVRRPGELVILVAHYDAFFGGANDNGTGTAIVMETARLLRASRLDRTVRLLLVDAEEMGMTGSNAYRKVHQGEAVRMALNLDMLGHQTGRRAFGQVDPERFDFLLFSNEDAAEDAFKVVQLGKRQDPAPRVQVVLVPANGLGDLSRWAGLVASDHATFWFEGQRALAPFPAGELPDDYHTPADTPDRIRWDRLEMVARLAVAAAGAFATLAE